MRTLNWATFRAARVWLDELPTWDYQVAEVITRDCVASKNARLASCKSAAELYIPMGGMAYYGALGAIFTPHDTDKLVVQVPISRDEGPLFDMSLANKTDEVHIGLPEEYVTGILDGFLHADTAQKLGAGTLRICSAAHGKIGSSVWLFRALSHILTQLLVLGNISIPNDELIGLIRSELNQKQGNLQQAAKNLEKEISSDKEEEQTVAGRIISLQAENQDERIVTIFADKLGKVSISMNADQYIAACDAHRDGHLVNVQGTLTKSGKRGSWTLLRPHDFCAA